MSESDDVWDDLSDLVEGAAAAAQSIARSAFEAFPDQRFYAFVLSNHDELDSLGFHMNSLESLEKITAGTGPEMADYYRWYWGEWRDFEYWGDQSGFDPVNDAIRRKVDATIEDYVIPKAAGAAVEALMLQTLKKLDADGLFGEGNLRSERLLYIGFYNSGRTINERSPELLNPPAVWEAHKASFNAWL
ncbi:MAG: DUF4303 domain-containing protein [Pseudomonadota bacterium]